MRGLTASEMGCVAGGFNPYENPTAPPSSNPIRDPQDACKHIGDIGYLPIGPYNKKIAKGGGEICEKGADLVKADSTNINNAVECMSNGESWDNTTHTCSNPDSGSENSNSDSGKGDSK